METPDGGVQVKRRSLAPLSLVDVSQRDWDRLAEKCRNLPTPSLGRATWLSIFSGGLLSSLSLAATVLLAEPPAPQAGVMWVPIVLLGLVCLAGVVWSALALRDERRRTASSRQSVLDEIQFIEESWAPPGDSGAPAAGRFDYLPKVGDLTPNAGTLQWNQPVTLEFAGGHSAGFEHIRWVRLFLGPSRRWNDNWQNQIYLSINPDGRLNLWDSGGKSHAAMLPGRGVLETDTASICLDETELTGEGETLRLRLTLRPKIRGVVRAFLTTVSNPDKEDTGIIEVGQFEIV